MFLHADRADATVHRLTQRRRRMLRMVVHKATHAPARARLRKSLVFRHKLNLFFRFVAHWHVLCHNECALRSIPEKYMMTTGGRRTRSAGSLLLPFAIGMWMSVAVALAQEATPKTGEPGTDQFYTANELFNRRLYPLAVAEYKAFLEKYPKHSKVDRARYGLALSLFSAGDFKDAEPVLAGLCRKDAAVDVNQVVLLRGQCLLELQRPADAQKILAGLLAGDAPPAFRNGALAGLTEAAFLQDNWSNVVAHGDSLVKADPEGRWTERATYQTGVARYRLRDFTNAVVTLKGLAGKTRDEAMARRIAFIMGESYREMNEFGPAAEQYAVALKGEEEPLAAEVQFRLGFAQMSQEKYGEASATFRQVLARKPTEDLKLNASLHLGRALLEKGEFQPAEQALAPVAKADSRFAAEATLWLARVWSRQAQYDKALQILEPAASRFQRDKLAPDIHFDCGNALMAVGRFEDGAAAFARVRGFKDWPQANDAVRLQALCLHSAGRFDESLAAASEFLARFPSDPAVPEVLFLKAENLYLLDRLDEAAPQFAAAAKADSEQSLSDEANLRIAQIHQRRGRWQDAIDAAAPLVARASEDSALRQVHFVLGDSYFRLEKWDEAITNLATFVDAQLSPGKKPPSARNDGGRKSSSKNPKRPAPRTKDVVSPVEANMDTALMELAVSLQRRSENKRAAAIFARLVDLFPQTPHRPLALGELGRLQYEDSDLRNARQTLERLLAEFPQAPQRCQAEYYLGWIALAEKKEPEAEKRFTTVQQQFPRDPLAADAILQRGMLLTQQEKHKDAAAVFQSLLQNYPDHPRRELARFSMGIACARMNSWQQSADILKKFTDDYPKSEMRDRVLYELAWAAKNLKQPQEAVRRYRQLLEEHPDSDLAEKVRTELVELTFDAKEFEKVIAELKSSIPAIKDPALREQAMYRLGTAYFNSRNFDESAATFEAFLKEHPKSALSASASFQAGESRMRTKETLLACDHFAAAAGTQDGAVREPALLRLGETQALVNQWKESADAYAAFLQAFPSSKFVRPARFGLGWARENLGQFDLARTEYTKVAAGAKDELAARSQFQLAECFFAQKKYDQAVQELARVSAAFNFKEWTAKASVEMGRVLEAKGDVPAAIAQFKDVIAKFPKHDVAVVAKERLDVLRRAQ